MEPLSKEDLILGDKPVLSISHAKAFLQHHEVKVADEEEELIGDETDILKVVKIEDNGNNKVKIILFR